MRRGQVNLLSKKFVPVHAVLVSYEKKEIIKNLYLSGIAEEFIALQLDLEIPTVISILKEFGIYNEG